MSKREIKFRMWYKGKMMPAGIRIGDLPPGGLVLTIDDLAHQWDIKGIPVMQYTGLKGRNGVEIYEGDVVDGKWPYARRGIVTWDSARCGFYIAPFNAGGKPGGRAAYDKGYKMNAAKVSIIGNIYENPELLKA